MEGVPEIDLFLGGHDHVYDVRQVSKQFIKLSYVACSNDSNIITQIDGRYLIKSGTDFRQFSKITLTFTGKNIDVDIEEINVTSKFPEDEALKLELEKFSGKAILVMLAKG